MQCSSFNFRELLSWIWIDSDQRNTVDHRVAFPLMNFVIDGITAAQWVR